MSIIRTKQRLRLKIKYLREQIKRQEEETKLRIDLLESEIKQLRETNRKDRINADKEKDKIKKEETDRANNFIKKVKKENRGLLDKIEKEKEDLRLYRNKLTVQSKEIQEILANTGIYALDGIHKLTVVRENYYKFLSHIENMAKLDIEIDRNLNAEIGINDTIREIE